MRSSIVCAGWRPLVALSLAISLSVGAEVLAGQQVVVELQGGERLAAEVDARTSAQQLWLRYAFGNAVILRPIDWDRVVRGTIGSDELEAAAFRAKALTVRSLHEPRGAEARAPSAGKTAGPTWAARSAGKNACPTWGDGPVQSIWADARLANWDADAADDGLLLRVVPLDGHGDPVAAAGTIEAELWDDRARYPRRLGRWTCLAGEIAKLHRLEFQADDPHADETISRLGTLRVSLAVPGQGVFECDVPDVALRRFSQPWTEGFRTRTGTH